MMENPVVDDFVASELAQAPKAVTSDFKIKLTSLDRRGIEQWRPAANVKLAEVVVTERPLLQNTV